mmetsp:Transcript_5602/g.13994  ORF Transcript_5602/g.13994 Transcript_5602/m.13994 type:complete len:211 (-) Transcript_5602:331-963(-)
MFVAPPCRSQTGRHSGEGSQSVGEFIDTMDVVVPQPSGVGHGQGQQKCRKRRCRFGSHGGANRQRCPNSEQLSLEHEVAFPPPLLLELIPQLSEVDLRRAVRRRGRIQHGGRILGALGQALVHLPPLRAVEGVHDVGGVAAVVPVDPVRAGGMGLPPPGEVVPRAVYPHVEGGAAVYLVACGDLDALGLLVAFPGRRHLGILGRGAVCGD